MNATDQTLLAYLKRPLSGGRCYREIMWKTGLTYHAVKHGLARLRKSGHLNGWEVAHDRPC